MAGGGGGDSTHKIFSTAEEKFCSKTISSTKLSII